MVSVCEKLKNILLPYFIDKNDVVDDLVTSDSTKVLSAKQGNVLFVELVDLKNEAEAIEGQTFDSLRNYL